MPDLGFFDLQETVTLLHPAGVDEFGDPISGSASTSQLIAGALYAPGITAENTLNDNQVQADGLLYIDPDLGIIPDPLDRVLIRGDTFEVVGRPRVWLNTVIEIPVRQVTG